MADYCFFLSYASNDRFEGGRDLIKAFFDDLNAEVKRRGFPDGGYFDNQREEGKWKADLELGLASSRILVPLYSPAYFRGAYCGKEWETFNLRFEENERKRYRDVAMSKVILPVCWTDPVNYPDKVNEYQLGPGLRPGYNVAYDGYPAVYKKYGLATLIRLKRHTQAYQIFVLDFALKLLEWARGQGGAKVRDLVDFDNVHPPFPGDNDPGIMIVRYVFVAGMRHEMVHLRAVSDCYPTVGDRRDWRPCYPDLDRQVEGIATGPAKTASKNPRILDLTPQLMDRLREARRLNNLIVLVVDPWSVRLPELSLFLQKFDAEAFPNSAVLVNWNRKDPELAAETAKLEEELKEHFKGRKGRKEYHKDPVSSVDELEDAVQKAFVAVPARLVELGNMVAAGDGKPSAAPVIGN